MKIKAIKNLNDYILKNHVYILKTTKQNIKLLYYTENNYYIVNDKIIKKYFKKSID